LFTLRYSSTLGGFDETPLAEFTRDKELLGFREHFFTLNEVPHLACVLTWQDAVVNVDDLRAARELRVRPELDRDHRPIPTGEGGNGRDANERRRERYRTGPDPAAGLDERERALFNSLRDWRSRKAHDEGVPPYLIFTNRHLVAMVTKRPDSPTALGHLSGIGPGKVKRYGKEVLALLATPAPTPEPAQAAKPADVPEPTPAEAAP
jgi:superfamily II DNA helicase RecQ